MFGLEIAIAGLFTQLASAGAQYAQAEKSAELAEERQSQQKAQQEIDDEQRRRYQAQEIRKRRASMEQEAINTGAATSSGLSGGLSALTTNMWANQASMSGQARTAMNITNINQGIANSLASSQLWEAVGKVGTTMASSNLMTPQERMRAKPLVGVSGYDLSSINPNT